MLSPAPCAAQQMARQQPEALLEDLAETAEVGEAEAYGEFGDALGIARMLQRGVQPSQALFTQPTHRAHPEPRLERVLERA